MPAPVHQADLLAEGRDIALMLAEAARAPDMGDLASIFEIQRERLLEALRETAEEGWAEEGAEKVGASHIEPFQNAVGRARLAALLQAVNHSVLHARAEGLDTLAVALEGIAADLGTIEAGR